MVRMHQHSPNTSTPMNDIEELYADDEIVVINKPPKLLSVPGRYEPDSAVTRLQKIYGDIHVIHRLDNDTSGIIVYGRNKKALTAIQQQFEKQNTHKIYEALVIGSVSGSHGCINLPICVDWPNRPLQMISHTQGRYALTRWKKLDDNGHESRMELYPKTGRSHQLRLHMRALGHAIVGDPFYAPESAAITPRMMLHARELSFCHPVSGKLMEMVCPTPF